MPLNTLSNQTSIGVKPKQTAFQNFQTTMNNMKTQQQPTLLSNFYGLAKNTTGNFQQQGKEINKQTTAQKDLYSDDKIKAMMDDLKSKTKTKIADTSTKLNTGVAGVGNTISFPGSPSDETIKGLNDGTYKANTTVTPEQNQANIDKINTDMVDGKIDDPENRKLLEGLSLGDSPVEVENLINAINTDGDWGASYTGSAEERNKQLENLRKQAIADLLGVEYSVADDVTPNDTWKGQLMGTNDYENLAYNQSQLLENPNSTPESVYGALGLSQTGNAYMDAMNRASARDGALGAMQSAEGTTANRDAATQGFTNEKKSYADTMKDIESRWDTAGAATQAELDKSKTDAKIAIEGKDIGIKSTEDIAKQAKVLTDAQAKAKGIKATNAKDSEYQALLKKNKDLYVKQVAGEQEAARVAQVKAERQAKVDDYRRDATTKGKAPEDVDAVISAAEAAGTTPEEIESVLSKLTDEELKTYVTNYGNAADTMGTVNKVIQAAGIAIPNLPYAVIAGLGGLIAQFVLEGKKKKYEGEQKRRAEAEAVAKKAAADAAALAEAQAARQEYNDTQTTSRRADGSLSSSDTATGSTGYTDASGNHYSGINGDER
jgi:hypothetical protein